MLEQTISCFGKGRGSLASDEARLCELNRSEPVPRPCYRVNDTGKIAGPTSSPTLPLVRKMPLAGA